MVLCIFSYTCWLFVYYLWRPLFMSFFLFFNRIVFLFWIFCIFWILTLYQIHDVQIISPIGQNAFSLCWSCLLMHRSVNFLNPLIFCVFKKVSCKERTTKTKCACFFSLGFQSLDTKHAWKMWSVSLVSAGLVEEDWAHVTTLWEKLNHAPKRPECVCCWRKGTTWKPRPLPGCTFVSVPHFCICGSICAFSVSQPGLNFERNQSLSGEMKCPGIRIWKFPAMPALFWTTVLPSPCWWIGIISFLLWLSWRKQKFLLPVPWRRIK